ncbi:MAG: hypothetical protein HYX26_02270 [Acidobacteriales bacterium]|nr:hypothetical protein [Terriglobales bacterium]
MHRLLLVAVLLSAIPAVASDSGYLYNARLVQAAPGHLLELIDLLKARMPGYSASGDDAPMWMRHSQGDHWDLLILYPMGSYAEYYRPERIARREQADRAVAGYTERMKEMIAWQEEVFVYGPPLADVRKPFTGSGFFHVEMFVALPGRHAELYKQREMENAFLRGIKRPENLIFIRAGGASWDLFTLGFYRDLKHYAESADVPDDQEAAAAKSAGFAGADQIGPYLRTLIRSHHDTLAVAVR